MSAMSPTEPLATLDRGLTVEFVGTFFLVPTIGMAAPGRGAGGAVSDSREPPASVVRALSPNPGEMSLAVAVMRLPHDDSQMEPEASALVDRGPSARSALPAGVEALPVKERVPDVLRVQRRLERASEAPENVRIRFSGAQTELNDGAPWHGIVHALAAEILSMIGETTQPPDAIESTRLSDAELRVMRYLPTNLSRYEIAQELYLSVNTVKTHIEHIYAKLDVHSRTEAVERARSIGLLSSRRSSASAAR